jgi:hypothetical protein
MPTTVRVDFFGVESANATRRRIEDTIKAHIEAHPNVALEVHQNSVRFIMSHAEWNEPRKAFSAAVWRVRDSNLPRLVDDAEVVRVVDLEIPAQSALAECMCFVYVPPLGACAVTYNHAGARHTRVGQFLEQMGVAGPVWLKPIPRTDALQRLQHTNIVRRFDFKLAAGRVPADQARPGTAVGTAISLASRLNAVNVRVEVSMGHQRGTMNADDIRNIVREVRRLGDAVSDLKVLGAADDDQEAELLNFLNDRVLTYIDVNETATRHLDIADCKSKLYSALDHRRGEFSGYLGEG